MDHVSKAIHPLTRRTFLGASGLGAAALAGLEAQASASQREPETTHLSHFAPKAKRAICLFQLGGPSQLEMWDHKPRLEEFAGTDLPDSVRGDQRLTRMTADQKRLSVAPSIFKFAQAGKSGTWISSLLPNTAQVVDELCVIQSMHTEAWFRVRESGASRIRCFDFKRQQPSQGCPTFNTSSLGKWFS